MNKLTKVKTVLVLAGPTAVGKTAISLEVAKQLSADIISADSRQCYQGMSIGTAMPTAIELQQVRHFFVNEFPVTKSITASDFESYALQKLDEIFISSNFAVVCGGTGLYIKALTEGLDEMPKVDKIISHRVNESYEKYGLAWLQEMIKNEDPIFYEKGEIANPARLLRALSFKRSTGQSILNYHTGKKKNRPFRIVKVALNLPRNILYDRINLRVDAMMEAGLLDEVKSLLPYRQLKNLQTVGYTELFDFLDKKCSLNEAVAMIKQHSRNYAKRQLTWFRKYPEYTWLDARVPNIANEIIGLLS
ncbi:MAG: tRNA (adenosine(37)-N6)-dimethylallyltransferase MiaA [Bacteroidetes bacterium]|nr:tRNA (adenosine(37)-N6)-dimethylallyltransferase MiaA [Bacteroidota bacterium]MBS1740374.1 tRNA (adenosine(37)-N6)-dimethylallyltransferase MiaA [Bacteroidota bacterium]MBS1775229.1 tRNA (adenosine(37)-N6)-dimethylallyltransferase MiaA [Bacteroidota bacterium]